MVCQVTCCYLLWYNNRRMIWLFVPVSLCNSSSTGAREDAEKFGEYPQRLSPPCEVLLLPEPFISFPLSQQSVLQSQTVFDKVLEKQLNSRSLLLDMSRGFLGSLVIRAFGWFTCSLSLDLSSLCFQAGQWCICLYRTGCSGKQNHETIGMKRRY